MSHYYYGNIDKQTRKNNYYRKVIFTTKNMQLVFMSIPKGEDIGTEIHKKISQFIRVESGKGYANISGNIHKLKKDFAILIPPGKKHNIVNTGRKPLKLYTIYSPPEHPKNRKQKKKPIVHTS
jgi:mannose-6-phosphate isomerase-like protein (cupin superfamily)